MGIIESLAGKLDKSPSAVKKFLASASLKYRVYTIPKRTHGYRLIAHPSKELKKYQRAFLELMPLAIHPCAMAYRKGLSIKDNALAHVDKKYLLKLDLENFFNSIDPNIFWKVYHLHEEVCEPSSLGERLLIDQLLFWCPSKRKGGKLVLSVGAPSSPMVSNFCMLFFDVVISKYCKINHISYTRYADDLTFSTNEKGALFKIPELVRDTLFSEFGNRVVLNNAKTKFSSRAHNRHVTGVTLSNSDTISVGRERKRYIKHLVHEYQLGRMNYEEILHLKGLLSHVSHIEPVFINSLAKKYGPDVLKRIHKE
ncbi:retron St85 family RNA-directed DNA polymerase [Chromobacterium subtsugae]|uniref:RNA-directed DNA polymerase n=1 Tax=Chromobacterium subtsugae TaxID=251747 RepID=A0ABS7FGN7_9NEIS|nr:MULTISPECIES: retron St85 family RNA-directed DNA polymerase [Chromobacterium]MBW7568008.1 retron St85 family RNA-directed DNA polymerase [Chromobacterium subtsugae]MBW8289235.1 retron St85 family RNA-directed DNA polymerase [Chromobacterium subtsugae]WSE92718.1 retron St85 family RNA-directed DNA polymerase [Chromobacterium subtsugae]WVH61096.1 retron St85 family RNA-directed DNA polymerase [Chromobacterium subtsugae]